MTAVSLHATAKPLSRMSGIEFHALADCHEPGLPTGGTWERLIAIARLSRSHYVIQLDADTLAMGPLAEVAAAVRDGRAFTHRHLGWSGKSKPLARPHSVPVRA